ncbi:MAG: septal ring lytic transglycosylase RlpA family protein [Spirochaetota bacterium]
MRQILFLLGIISLISCSSTANQVQKAEKSDNTIAEKTDSQEIIAKNTDTNPPKQERTAQKTEQATKPKNTQKKFDEIGFSSWYGEQFQGKKTASGEPFDRFQMTAAHRTLPFGSVIKVHNLENNLEATLRVNDRGPFSQERLIDVSEKAAEVLKFKESGKAKVGISLVKAVTVQEGKMEDSLDDFLEDDLGSEEDFLNEIDSEDEPKKTNPSPTKKEDSKKAKKDTSPTPSPKGDSKINNAKPKGYTVQLGFFSQKENANKFSGIAKAYKQKLFIYQRGKAYVVQLGEFANRNDAISLQKDLKEKGIPSFVPLSKP